MNRCSPNRYGYDYIMANGPFFSLFHDAIRYNKSMELFALIASGLLTILLVAVGSVKVRRTRVSKYELLRRSKEKSKSAEEELRRELLVDDVRSLLRVIEAVLLVFATALSLFALGSYGIVVMVFVALFYGRIGHFGPVHIWAQGIFSHVEPKFLDFVEKSPQLMRLIRSIATSYEDPVPCSREEIEHIIKESRDLLSPQEKNIILSSMQFGDKRVEDVMTPRGVITALKHDTFIGPLALNDLHQSGHGRFPVMKEDIDHIVGILYLQDLVTLSTKESKTAEELMDGKVYYIERTQTLREALAAFLHVKHHMFIVINEYRETAGIITLEDVMEALIGQKIIDEFDVHDDMRLVAERSASHRNNPPKKTDV